MLCLYLRSAALVLTLVLLAIPGLARGQDATPDAAGTPSAGATTQPLFATELAADLLPSGEARVMLRRETWDVGSRKVSPAGAEAAGVSLSLVVAGSVLIHVDGPLLVADSAIGGPTSALQPIQEAVTLDAGDLVAFPYDAALHARNVGQIPATLLSVAIVSTAPPTGDPQSPRSDGVFAEQIGAILPDEWAAVPPGPLHLDLERTLLPPGASLDPYPLDPWAPKLLAVEAGLMEVGSDFDGDGMADSWDSLQEGWFLPLPTDAITRTIRASAEAPMMSLDHLDPKPGPLVFLTLAFTPTNPPPRPTPTPGPTPTQTVAPADCEALAAWNERPVDGLAALDEEEAAIDTLMDELIYDAESFDQAAIVDLLRRRAAYFSALAQFFRSSEPPALILDSVESVAAAFDAFASLHEEIAGRIERGELTTLDEVVDAIDAGSTTIAEVLPAAIAPLDSAMVACGLAEPEDE